MTRLPFELQRYYDISRCVMTAWAEKAPGRPSHDAIILQLHPWVADLKCMNTRKPQATIIAALDKPEPHTVGN